MKLQTKFITIYLFIVISIVSSFVIRIELLNYYDSSIVLPELYRSYYPTMAIAALFGVIVKGYAFHKMRLSEIISADWTTAKFVEIIKYVSISSLIFLLFSFSFEFLPYPRIPYVIFPIDWFILLLLMDFFFPEAENRRIS